MSTFKVEMTTIDEVENHPNADRLDLVRINDWRCVTGKGQYKAGDRVIYLPIDSILPPDLECKLFPIDSKVKLAKSRIRTIKLRGAISQGMVVNPAILDIDVPVGTDLTKHLGITKYEPPTSEVPANMNVGKASPKQENPHFRKYGGIENAKNYPETFMEGEYVVVTEKIHGTNFRCGYVPFHADTFFKKVLKFFRLAPKYEFVYGSNNVQLQNKMFYKGYYDKNVYAEAVVMHNLHKVLKKGEVIYGEVFGYGVQKGYTYGCAPGERKLAIFDVMVDGRYLDPDKMHAFCIDRGLPVVPVLYAGKYNKQLIRELTEGDSVLAPTQKVREGVVVKPIVEQTCMIGRKKLKFISDSYLLKDQTDFH